EQAGVSGRIRTRRAADRRLIDFDDLVEQLQALDVPERRRLLVGAIQFGRRLPVQGVVDQGRLARTGNAGDAGQQAGGDLDVDAFQVVAAGAEDAQHALAVRRAALFRHLDASLAGQVLASQGLPVRKYVLEFALGDDF